MIQDPRIGRRGPKGRIVQVPTKYVSGEGYVPAANPAPTIFWLDQEQEYFIILPVSMSRIRPETHANLLMLVGKGDQIDFPYNHSEDDQVNVYPEMYGEDEEDDVVVESAAQRKARQKAEAAKPKAAPKKTVKVVNDQTKFSLPAFNKRAQANNEDDEDGAYSNNKPVVPKTKAGIGLVSKTTPRPKSGIDPQKPNISN